MNEQDKKRLAIFLSIENGTFATEAHKLVDNFDDVELVQHMVYAIFKKKAKNPELGEAMLQVLLAADADLKRMGGEGFLFSSYGAYTALHLALMDNQPKEMI